MPSGCSRTVRPLLALGRVLARELRNVALTPGPLTPPGAPQPLRAILRPSVPGPCRNKGEGTAWGGQLAPLPGWEVRAVPKPETLTPCHSSTGGIANGVLEIHWGLLKQKASSAIFLNR